MLDSIKPSKISIIVKEGTEEKVEINEAELAKVLLNPKCADKKVCIVSVAGAFHGGKSFILNLFLRYLNWTTKGSEGDWLANDGPLDGFDLGASNKTQEILMWPEPFVVKDEEGDEIAVILMDTQGNFDNNSTLGSCTTIFALSTLISSVQVYNIKGGSIGMDQLQHVQMFTEYARLAMDSETAKPFQKLLFLVRDWQKTKEAEYGLTGGQKILDDMLKDTTTLVGEYELVDSQGQPIADELLPPTWDDQLREHIKSSSSEGPECFLMPHPGIAMENARGFHCPTIADIGNEFKAQLRSLVSHLFDGKKLTLKTTMGGRPVMGRELLARIKNNFQILNSGEFPEQTVLLDRIANSYYPIGIGHAKTIYEKEMEKNFSDGAPCLCRHDFRAEHERCLAMAIHSFGQLKEIGGQKMAQKFRAQLEGEIEAMHNRYEQRNKEKREQERQFARMHVASVSERMANIKTASRWPAAVFVPRMAVATAAMGVGSLTAAAIGTPIMATGMAAGYLTAAVGAPMMVAGMAAGCLTAAVGAPMVVAGVATATVAKLARNILF